MFPHGRKRQGRKKERTLISLFINGANLVIEPIFAWNVPLVALIFLKRSLVFPILLFSPVWKWKWSQSCLTLCDPMDYSQSGSSVHGIPQARILEWVAIPFSRGSSWPRGWTQVFCIAGGFFTIWATREAHQIGLQDRNTSPGTQKKTSKHWALFLPLCNHSWTQREVSFQI